MLKMYEVYQSLVQLFPFSKESINLHINNLVGKIYLCSEATQFNKNFMQIKIKRKLFFAVVQAKR